MAREYYDIIFGDIFDYRKVNVNYGMIVGSRKNVVIINTGEPRDIFGEFDRYLKLARKIYDSLGYSVVVTSNPNEYFDSFDNDFYWINEKIKPDKKCEYTYIGYTSGGTVGLACGKFHPEIKEMLLVNTPLEGVNKALVKEFKNQKCKKVIMVYGSDDESFEKINILNTLKSNRFKVFVQEGMDHNCSKNPSLFLNLPFEYILKKRRIRNERIFGKRRKDA